MNAIKGFIKKVIKKSGFEIQRISNPDNATNNTEPIYSNRKMIGVFSSHENNVDIFQYADSSHPLVNSFKKKLNKTYQLFIHPCVICSSTDFTDVAQSKEGFRWGLCKECGLLQIYNRFSKDTLDEFYKSGEYQTICMGNLNDKKTFILEYQITSLYFIDILNSLKMNPHDSHIIEIGCGSGGILKALKEWGAGIVKGYDIDEHRVNYGKKEIEEIEVGDALALDPSIYSGFNVILLSNVLEHLVDPLKYLSLIASKIQTDNVRVIIDVPNLEYCYSYSNESFLRFLHIGHLWYFSPLTIERLLNQAGLGIDYVFPRQAVFTVVCTKKSKPSSNSNNAYWNSVSAINYANFCNNPHSVSTEAKRRMKIIET